ncbi:hypothetical protein FRC00_011885 [Tulasnella sp. 408]|nr:hypothetical protein FRC00_011885 [Tulasnella sp. 408]
MHSNSQSDQMNVDNGDDSSSLARRRAAEAAEQRQREQISSSGPLSRPGPLGQHAWRKDPDFFAPVAPGNLVEDTLFCIHAWDFRTISPVLCGLSELGQKAEIHTASKESSSSLDGQPISESELPNSEANPIIVGEPTTAAGFRALLKWLHPHHHNDGPLSKDDWKCLLPVAHFYQIDKAFKTAVVELDPRHYYFEPTQRLWFALAYEIPQWIRTTLLELIQSDQQLTKEQVDRLKSFHEPAFRALVAVRAALIRHRHRLMLLPPTITHSEECTTGSRTAHCQERWVGGIAVKSFLGDAVARVQQVAFSECLQLTYDDVKLRGVLWRKEAQILEQGMQEIIGPEFSVPVLE